jgi:hypothetical protein
MKNNNFKKWLDTFIKEKHLPMEDIFEINKGGNLNIMSYKTIYEHILITTKEEQQKIKDTIVKIDFLNGNVLNFFKHLGNAIARKGA